MANLSDFKAQMIGGGARANQFRVDLSFPNFVTAGTLVGINAQFMCKAAQLPQSTIDNTPVFYRGRQVNFAGERTFAPWTVSVYNDTTFAVRNALERWSDGIMNHTATNGRTNPGDYQVDLLVTQLDRNGAAIKSYTFRDAYPTVISPIQLDYETNNVIEMFDVEWTYNYWTSNTTGAGSGFGINVAVDTPIGTFPLPF
jgi:hypothetical protein